MLNEKQKKLVEENHNLIYAFLNKYGFNTEDYYDLAAIGMCKAAQNFNENKGTFSTLAYRCMLNEVLIEHRKNNSSMRIPLNNIISIDEPLASDDCKCRYVDMIPSHQNVEDEVVSNCVVGGVINSLSKRDRTIVDLLSKGYKQTDISEIMKLSQAQVSRIRKKVLQSIKKYN